MPHTDHLGIKRVGDSIHCDYTGPYLRLGFMPRLPMGAGLSPALYRLFILNPVDGMETSRHFAITIERIPIILQQDGGIRILLRLDGGRCLAHSLRADGEGRPIPYVVSP